MTAHELAQQLLGGPDLPVHFAYNYGDHWRTEVAAKVRQCDTGLVAYSSYHNMDKTVDTEADDYDPDPASRAPGNDHREVVLLR